MLIRGPYSAEPADPVVSRSPRHSRNLAQHGGIVAANIQMRSLFPWHIYLKPCHTPIDEHMSLS